MTRKDYVAIAAILHASNERIAGNPTATRNDMILRGEANLEVAEDMADHFAADNPRFDRSRFLRACGYAGS